MGLYPLLAMEARRRVEYGELVQRCHACDTKLGVEPLPPLCAEPHEGRLLMVKCYNCNAENEVRVGKVKREAQDV